MNNKILLLMTCALAMTACAAPRPNADNIVPCPGGGSKVITIVTTQAQFSVAPPHLCIPFNANDDTEIQVNFTAGVAADTVTLSPKSGVTAPWLNATNPGPSPNQATITVPAGTAVDTYYYNITATGWGVIDPMISVE